MMKSMASEKITNSIKRYGVLPAIAAFMVTFAVPARGTPDTEEKTAAPTTSVSAQQSVKQLIFEEQKIEGKIRRPQLVLIKADQRPEFNPMIMQSLGKAKNIATLVDQELLEENQYRGAFKFEGVRIVNITP
ncbi:MAG: hypothetical protein JXA71_03895 [Chitinispirillaceae bacterium]|nr:hypothetical protein [Chitinispirillaceae bacterium]